MRDIAFISLTQILMQGRNSLQNHSLSHHWNAPAEFADSQCFHQLTSF